MWLGAAQGWAWCSHRMCLCLHLTLCPPAYLQVLLTLDDDLDTVQRDKIYVF